MVERSSEVEERFQSFQKELDEYNDRRERLIKSSRDITTASKRLIFALHRFPHQAVRTGSQATEKEEKEAEEGPRSSAAQKVLSDAHTKRDEIVKMIVDASMREGFDLEFRRQEQRKEDGSEKMSEVKVKEIGRAERYERAMGGGLEEFVSSLPTSIFHATASV